MNRARKDFDQLLNVLAFTHCKMIGWW